MARFVDYYSLVWGPGAISTIDDPRGALTSRSSTLAVLVDYGPFRGLFINPRRSGRLEPDSWAITYRFGRLWSVSWTITHCFGVQERFPLLTIKGCSYVLVINNRSFGRFWPVSWTITYRFEVPQQFL